MTHPIYRHSQPVRANVVHRFPAPTADQEMLQYQPTTPPPVIWHQVPQANHNHSNDHPVPSSAQQHFVRYTVPSPSATSLALPPRAGFVFSPRPLISQPRSSFYHAPSLVYNSSTEPSPIPVAESSALAPPLVLMRMPPPPSSRPPFDQSPSPKNFYRRSEQKVRFVPPLPDFMRMPPPFFRPFNPPPQPLVPTTSTTIYNVPPPPVLLTVPFNTGPPVQASTMPSSPLYAPTGPPQMFLNTPPPASSLPTTAPSPRPPTTPHPRTRVKIVSKPARTSSRLRRRPPALKTPSRRPGTVLELIDMSPSSLRNLMTPRSTKRWFSGSLPPPPPPSSPDIITMDNVSKTLQTLVVETPSDTPDTLPSASETPGVPKQNLVLPPPQPNESTFENECIRVPAEDQSRNDSGDATKIFKSEALTVVENESFESTSQIFNQDDNDQNQNSYLTPGSVHLNLTEKNKKKIDNGDGQLNKSFDELSASTAVLTNEEDDSRSFGIYIADKLLKYSSKTRSSAQYLISNILYQADEGAFE